MRRTLSLSAAGRLPATAPSGKFQIASCSKRGRHIKALFGAENLVARFEMPNVPADRFDFLRDNARHITPRSRDLPFAYGGHYATEKGVS